MATPSTNPFPRHHQIQQTKRMMPHQSNHRQLPPQQQLPQQQPQKCNHPNTDHHSHQNHPRKANPIPTSADAVVIGNATIMNHKKCHDTARSSLSLSSSTFQRRKSLDLSKVKKNSQTKTGKSIMSSALAGLPSQPEYWDRLTTLYLCGNQLKYLPESVGSLAGLTELWVSDNSLTSLPSTISNLKQLVFLRANNNQLKTIPKEIGRLKRLQKLHLGHNKLVALPAEICNLDLLRELLLSWNEIVHLPEAIGDLSHLVKLHLNKNNLWRLPDSICWLHNLRSCRIDGNEALSGFNLDHHHQQQQRINNRMIAGRGGNPQVSAAVVVQNSHTRMLRAAWTPRSHCIFGILCNRTFITVIMSGNRIIELPPLMWEMIFAHFKGVDMQSVWTMNRLTHGSLKRRGYSL